MASIYGNTTADAPDDWWAQQGYVEPTAIDQGTGIRLGTQPVVPRQQMPPTTSSDTPQPTGGSLADLTQPATTTNFGNLEGNAAGWMAVAMDPAQREAWVRQELGANATPELVKLYSDYIAGQPGANPTEQAGGAQFWRGKIQEGLRGQGGSAGAMGPFYGVGAFNPAAPFNGLPSDFTQDPSYQWRFGQGQEALENSAAARGTLLTGGALKDLVNYGQGAASQEYAAQFGRGLALNQNAFTQGLATNQNAFNQGMGVNQNLFNQNYSLAGLGLNATNSGINGAGGQAANATSFAGGVTGPYANAAGNNITGAGNAAAAGTVGSQNAYNNLYGLYSGLFR